LQVTSTGSGLNNSQKTLPGDILPDWYATAKLSKRLDMARLLGATFPGSFYHVNFRGNEQKAVS